MPTAVASPTFSLPIAVLLIPYGLFLLFFSFYTFFNLYHLLRYGFSGSGLSLLLGTYTLGSFILLASAILVLMQFDWGHRITLGNLFELSDQILFPDISR